MPIYDYKCSKCGHQLEIIQKNTQIIYSSLENIESHSGGSARCMIAEVF